LRISLNFAVPAGLAAVLMASPGALRADPPPVPIATNYALASDGASVVTQSSYVSTVGNNLLIMQNDVISNTAQRVAWNTHGEKRFIFGKVPGPNNTFIPDPNQMLEVSLGQLESVNSIGAIFNANPNGDRPVTGPFSIMVSNDGTTWTSWGSPVTIQPGQKVTDITLPTFETIEYIEYFFGPASHIGTNIGSAISQVFAGVPEPASVGVMLGGLALLFGLRRRTKV
jgi:hypothetical protein